MSSATIHAALLAYQNRKKIFIVIISIFFTIVLLPCIIIALFLSKNLSTRAKNQLSPEVEMYRYAVVEVATKYDIADHVDTLLAIMMVESEGKGGDPMQASESLGLEPNAIEDPMFSIETGVSYFSKLLRSNQAMKNDFWTVVQSYNFGGGFGNFIASEGNTYSFDLACKFSEKMSKGEKVLYFNKVANENGYWRYNYGNMYYVKLVQQYVLSSNSENFCGVDPLGQSRFDDLKFEFEKYNGWNYTWGGYCPNSGFDCSGLVQYCYFCLGYHLPRTAEEQYNATVPVDNPEPGDLIFFENTSDQAVNITHVAIYVDQDRMFHSCSSGIEYSNWNSEYWKNHLVGFGRVSN